MRMFLFFFFFFFFFFFGLSRPIFAIFAFINLATPSAHATVDPGVGVLCALQQQLWAVYVHENPQVIDPDFNEEHHSFLKVLLVAVAVAVAVVGGGGFDLGGVRRIWE